MPKASKLVLATVAGSVLGFIAIGVAGALVIQSKRGSLDRDIERVVLAAEEFAAGGGTQNGCIWQAYEDSKGCGVVAPICETKIGVYLRHCLLHTTPEEATCAGVPREDQIIESAQWASGKCGEQNRHEHDLCTRIFQTVQKYCNERHDRPKHLDRDC